MTLTINLDQEGTDVFTAIVAARNLANGTDVTITQHLTEHVGAEIIRAITASRAAKVTDRLPRLALLPYTVRQEIDAFLLLKISENP